jgi:hypothetical protein
MLGRERSDGVRVRARLGTECAQLRLQELAQRRLRDSTGEDLLGCGVEPGRWQGAYDGFPEPRLGGVELGGGRWPGKAGGTIASEMPDLRPRAISECSNTFREPAPNPCSPFEMTQTKSFSA